MIICKPFFTTHTLYAMEIFLWSLKGSCHGRYIVFFYKCKIVSLARNADGFSVYNLMLQVPIRSMRSVLYLRPKIPAHRDTQVLALFKVQGEARLEDQCTFMLLKNAFVYFPVSCKLIFQAFLRDSMAYLALQHSLRNIIWKHCQFF